MRGRKERSVECNEAPYTPTEPMVQITPVENGYLITAYNGKGKQGGLGDLSNVMNTIFAAVHEGKDPAEVFKKIVNQENLKESVKRKPVEYHVSKSIDEALKLVGEILGSMKA